jgi:predicted kinase
MLSVYITKGISGSGKTFWAKEQISSNPGGVVIVCKDDIRNMLWNGEYSKGREDLVRKTQDSAIIAALNDGKNVIAANTNFDDHEANLRKLISNWCKETGKQVEVKLQDFTDVSLELCIERDSKRSNPLGEKIIRAQYNRWIKKDEKPFVLEQNRSNLPAIIVDLDGTLAHMNGRGPYEWNRVDEDDVDESVSEIIKLFSDTDTHILIVTGRDESCREKCIKWLDRHDIWFSRLFMRPAGDSRKDCIIKEEIFNQNIRDFYYVKFVLDDRNQVVETWRRLGLKCFQVAPGDF